MTQPPSYIQAAAFHTPHTSARTTRIVGPVPGRSSTRRDKSTSRQDCSSDPAAGAQQYKLAKAFGTRPVPGAVALLTKFYGETAEKSYSHAGGRPNLPRP